MRGKKSATNLELQGASRAVKEASVLLFQPRIPKLCLLSQHSNLAEGGSNLEDRMGKTKHFEVIGCTF